MIQPLLLQLTRFFMVGVAAAALHYSIVVALVQGFALQPLLANIIGFCCGFQISYWGHRSWTFRGTQAAHRAAVPKMIIVQTSNFVANESMFYILLALGLPYNIALLIVLSVLPIFTYTASRLWVFGER